MALRSHHLVKSAILNIALMLVRSHFCFWLLLTLARVGFAQAPLTKHYHKATGLASERIYDLAFDSTGFLWLGQDVGLTRFDGQNARTYTIKGRTGPSVTDVHVLNDGRIICQNFSGQRYVLRPGAEFLEPLGQQSGNLSPTLVLPDGTIYIGWGSHLGQLVDDSLVLESRLNEFIFRLWPTDSGLAVLTGSSIQIIQNGAPTQTISLSEADRVAHFPVLHMGKRLSVLALSGQLQAVEHSMSKSERIALVNGNQMPQHATSTNQGKLLWVCTTDGLFVFDENLKLLPLAQPLLVGESVSGVIEGPDGSYWVSTIENGLYQLAPLSAISKAITSGRFTVFGDARFPLLAGTNQGQIYSIGPDLRLECTHTLPVRHMVNVLSTFNGATVVGSDRIYNLKNGRSYVVKNFALKTATSASSKKLILGCPNSIFAFDGRNLSTYSTSNESYRPYASINFPDANHVAVATSAGVYLVNGLSDSIRMLNSEVHAGCLATQGKTLLAGTPTGLYSVDANGKAKLWPGAEMPISKMAAHGAVVYAVSAGNLYHWSNGKFERSVINNFLNDEPISDIVIISEKVLLLVGSRLLQWPVGLDNNPTPTIAPRLGLALCGSEPINPFIDIELPHNRNTVNLMFEFPWFGNATDLGLKYRLNSGDWVELDGRERSINLPFLTPGSYTVQLSSALNTEPVNLIAFTILQPWYLRWWAILLMLGSVIATIWGLFSYRIRHQKKHAQLVEEKLRLEQQLDRSITAAIRSQMNPHFLFNALNTIQAYIYQNDRDNATEYLGKFAKLTRTVLTMSTADNITLSSEIEALRLYLELEQMRFNDSFVFAISTQNIAQPDQVQIPSMLIQPYVENAVKHGLLHKKGDRRLNIEFSENNGRLKVVIEDNGVGRQRSARINEGQTKRHSPFSSTANSKRMELLNREHKGYEVHYLDLLNEQHEPQGTRVTLYMPLLTFVNPKGTFA